MMQALDGLWEKICENVRRGISPDAFQRWFAPARLVETGEDTLTLAVPNSIQQLWIESNYATLLQDAIILTLGDRRVVKFRVEMTAPVISRGAEMAGGGVGGDLFDARGSGGAGSEAGLGVAGSAGARAAGAAGAAGTVGSGGSAGSVGSAGAVGEGTGGFNARYVFENFVVGSSNQFAHAAALAVAENPARIYNPLFIHGGVGLGKTHLMQAIGHHIVAHRKKARVIYISSEQFTNEFIDAIQQGTLPKFRRRYRQADVLLIDDVQFFAGKERSQDEFFHTFNALFDGHRQIVMTSDRPPSEMQKLEARLVSRFEWGIAAEMQVPDVETRTAILRKKMAQLQVTLPDDVVRFLAERISNNVRRLEGSLMRLASFVSLSREKLTQPRVEELLRDLLQEDARNQVTIDKIQRVVAEHYDVRLADMTSKRRPACIAFPRQVAMALARDLTRASYSEIGAAFGGRDHGTVMHACKLITARTTEDPKIRSVIMLLESRLKA
jgi:chromosomal replication initiator protein